MPVTLANWRQKCSVLLYPHSGLFALIRYIAKTRSAGFLSLASYARTHDLNSKAKVTAISGKVS